MKDHAVALADALRSEELACELFWCRREERSLLPAWREVQGWLERLDGDVRAFSPQVTLLHYSVFSYSQQGVPLFVPSMVRTLRRANVPMIVMLHEFVFPWSTDGMRGKAWAITQRAALIEVMRAADSVVVTTDARAQWLAFRRWLPRRPTVVAPVFSNMPTPSTTPPDVAHDSPRIGLFGYSYGPATADLVLDAVGILREQGTNAELHLLGAPGESSPAGHEWVRAARDRGMSEVLTFSGVLPAQALSDRLASCDVLVFADPAGPSSRKTTLAAALSSGVSVVAIDGPDSWSTLLRHEVLAIAEPTDECLADAISALLSDAELRRTTGQRGREFAERYMSIEHSARTVRGLVDALLRTEGKVVAAGHIPMSDDAGSSSARES